MSIYDLVKFYSHEISDTSSLRSCFCTNAAYQGLKHPMKQHNNHPFVPDFSHRYLTEDVPYGLAVIKGIAEIVQVDTPTIDKILLWAQEKMGKEYFVGSKRQGKDFSFYAITLKLWTDLVGRYFGKSLVCSSLKVY